MKSSYFMLMLIPLLLLSVFSGLSVLNWLSAWVLLEINMILVLVYLLMDEVNKIETGIKYFIAQGVASSFMLLFIFCVLSQSESYMYKWGVILSLIMKLGAAPLHFWYLDLIWTLSWQSLWIVSTIQKILPFFFLIQISGASKELWVLWGGFIGCYGALTSKYFMEMMGYSSVFSLSWMFLSWNVLPGLFYLFCYGLALLFLFKSVSASLSSLYTVFLSSNFMSSILGLTSFLSMAGIPPLLGFSAKVLIILIAAWEGHSLLIYLLVQLSVVMLYVYLRAPLSSLMSGVYQSWTLSSSHTVFSTVLFIMLGVFALLYLLCSSVSA